MKLLTLCCILQFFISRLFTAFDQRWWSLGLDLRTGTMWLPFVLVPSTLHQDVCIPGSLPQHLWTPVVRQHSGIGILGKEPGVYPRRQVVPGRLCALSCS